jgi:nucleoside-diphosphate-sugar epimerase
MREGCWSPAEQGSWAPLRSGGLPTAGTRSGYSITIQRGRPGEVERNFASYDLAQKVLGYAPSISREVGIPKTWQWFQDSVFRP